MLSDGRFQSSMESEGEDGWLPMQVLQAVCGTPSLPEEVQVEVMKVCVGKTLAARVGLYYIWKLWTYLLRVLLGFIDVFVDC